MKSLSKIVATIGSMVIMLMFGAKMNFSDSTPEDDQNLTGERSPSA